MQKNVQKEEEEITKIDSTQEKDDDGVEGYFSDDDEDVEDSP